MQCVIVLFSGQAHLGLSLYVDVITIKTLVEFSKP